jgi:hypothetical protein
MGYATNREFESIIRVAVGDEDGEGEWGKM